MRPGVYASVFRFFPSLRQLAFSCTVLLGASLFQAALLGGHVALAGGVAPANPCIAEDDGAGSVALPPEACSFRSPQDTFEIIDGLPPGTTIELEPILRGVDVQLVEAGGGLGGLRTTLGATLVLRATGNGALAGFERILHLDPIAAEIHSAPSTPFDPVQSFDTDLFQLQGAFVGDPDFASFQMIAGTAFGLPSFGHVTLTERGDGTFHVDSFFDVQYQLSFVGAPGGALDGLAGTTQGTVRLEAQGQRDPCIVADNGSGTAVLPPAGCEYLTQDQGLEIVNGLPAGTTIELSARHRSFVCTGTGGACSAPGGNLGGEVETFDSELVLELLGTGSLTGWRRTLRLPPSVVTHSGPRTPGNPVQSFLADVSDLQGAIAGDPDFAQFDIIMGNGQRSAQPRPHHPSGFG